MEKQIVLKRLSLLLINLFLVAQANLYAQDNPAGDTVADSISAENKKPFIVKPTSIRIGTDLYKVAVSTLDKGFFGYEINADLSLNNHIFATVDYGYHKAEREGDESQFLYGNEGFYFRVGAEYNLIGRQFAKNAVFLGVKYAVATFDHSISQNLENNYWNGTVESSTQQEGLIATWVEGNLGMKIEVARRLYLVSIVRVGFQTSLSESPSLSVGELPGYGKNTSNIRMGFGYQILYALPFAD